MSDPLLDMIARLPPATMSAERTRRVATRCHRVLAPQATAHELATRARRWQIWSRALIALVAVFFTEAIRQALRVYGR